MKTVILSALVLLSIAAQAQTTSDYGTPVPVTPPPPVVQPAVELTQVVINDENEHLLTDSFQRTLYTFDLDIGKPTSACNQDCAEVWPPYLISADEAKSLKAPYGGVVRANKKTQLTYNGMPLYTYFLDRSIADDLGDGVGGVWHYVEIK